MGSGASDAPELVDGMPREVVAQILKDLDRGPKIIDCLRTAGHLIAEAREDTTGLRLVESAAYNLREALDALVVGQEAGESALDKFRDAYRRYGVASAEPGADEAAVLRALATEVGRVATDTSHQDFRTRQFLGWLKSRTGIAPLPGDDDPSAQLARLRRRVNGALHDSGTLANVAGFYDEGTSWFTRLFTPPDDRVRRIIELARNPFGEAAQVQVLRTEIAYNAHHLGRFLAEARDPAWLDALFDDGLIHPPRDDEPWPVASLVGGNGGIAASDTVALLSRLRASTAASDAASLLRLDRNLVQLGLRLGEPSHALVIDVVAKHGSDHWIQRLAVNVAREADPASPVVVAVADAVINSRSTSDAGYQTRTMTDLLIGGINTDNARERFALLASKLERLATHASLRVSPPDIAALNTPDADGDLRDEPLIVTERFVNAIGRWRELGLPTSELVALVEPIGGQLGERILCRVLVGAEDVTRKSKLAHLALRLHSPTASGDDRDLLADLGQLTDVEIAELAIAFGAPSEAPESDGNGMVTLPADWARAWRWSMLLPPAVLDSWTAAIEAVIGRHGPPDPEAFSASASEAFLGAVQSAAHFRGALRGLSNRCCRIGGGVASHTRHGSVGLKPLRARRRNRERDQWRHRRMGGGPGRDRHGAA